MSRLIGTFLLVALFLPARNPLNSQELSFADIQSAIGSGELNTAADQLSDFIRKNPDSIKAYIASGRVHLAIGSPNNHTEAERILLEIDRPVQNSPDRAKAAPHRAI